MGFWWQPKPVGGPAGNTYCLLYEEVELLSSWSSSSSSSVWAGTFWGVLNVLLNISENHDCHFYFWNQHQYQCQVDEGNVEIVRILGFSSTTPDLRPDVEEFRYPRFFHHNKGYFDHHGLFHRADTPNATSTLRMLRFTLSSKQEVHLSLSALRCSTHSNLSRLWMWRVMTWEPPWPPRSPGWNTSSGSVGPTMAPISGPRLVICNGYQPCLIFAKKMLVFSRVDSNLQKTRFCVYIFSFKRNVVSPPAARPEPATLGACPYSRESVCSQV